MALQDLTPQLRTRLSRVEKAVGWFVLLAALLLTAGFVYYIWHTAQRKGWFVDKIQFCTGAQTAVGIKPGDPVRLMGFNIGEVTKIVPNDPWDYYGLTVFFEVRHDTNNYIGYIWSDSQVRIAASDFLGGRALEVLKGQDGVPVFDTRPAGQRRPHKIAGVLNSDYIKKLVKENKDPLTEYRSAGDKGVFYLPYSKTNKPFWIDPAESPALTERMERVVTQAEKALPNILALTNRLQAILLQVESLTSNLNMAAIEARPGISNATALMSEGRGVVADIKPVLSNLTVISTTLTNPQGSFGEWLLPTNLLSELKLTLQSAQGTLSAGSNTLFHADTNLTALMDNLGRSLDSLAGITSNLNRQVEANTNILSEISSAVRNTDILVQGLRRHWLLRSAFKTNAPPQPKKK